MEDFLNMTIHEMAKIFSDNYKECPDEFIHSLKSKITNRINIKLNEIKPLTPDTSYLVNMKPEFVRIIYTNNKESNRPITILLSPPNKGEYSNCPLWHMFDITTNNIYYREP